MSTPESIGLLLGPSHSPTQHNSRSTACDKSGL